MKKQSNLYRLLDYAGKYRILTYLSWMFSAVSALLALTYLMPVVLLAFKRDFYNSQFPVKKEANLPMLIPITITAACSLILGVMPNFGLHLYDLAAMAGNAIFGLSL